MGLFGFRESISASFVTESLTIDSITALGLISWTILVAAPGYQRAAPGQSPSQDLLMTIREPRAVEDGRYPGLGTRTIHRSSSPQQAKDCLAASTGLSASRLARLAH